MTPNPSPLPLPSPPVRGVGDVELLERLARARADLLAQVGRRIVGQQDVLDGILTAVFSGGHALLRSEEHTSELQSQSNLVCRLLLEKKNIIAWSEVAPAPFRQS